MRAAVAALALVGCESGPACPEAELEVRPFAGTQVIGTETSCTPSWTINGLCRERVGPRSGLRSGPLEPRCGVERFGIIVRAHVWHALVFFVDEQDDGWSPRVRAAEEYQCDVVPDCELQATPALGGWIMPEGPITDPRGRFMVQFPGYVIEGQYGPEPPPDAAVDAAGAADAGPDAPP